MKKIEALIILILGMIIAGCSSTRISEKKWRPTYRIQAGVNKGGIVENTQFEASEEIIVDAYSGATRLGAHAGGHVLLPVGNNCIETGADLMFNHQKFTYNDHNNQFTGKQTFNLFQAMFPVVYNVGIYRKIHPDGLIQLKFGYLGQLNFLQQTNSIGTTPEHGINTYSGGVTIGVTSTPFVLQNGSKLGIYFDVYRGGQILKDFYNKANYEEPGSSFIKTGLIYQFNL